MQFPMILSDPYHRFQGNEVTMDALDRRRFCVQAYARSVCDS